MPSISGHGVVEAPISVDSSGLTAPPSESSTVRIVWDEDNPDVLRLDPIDREAAAAANAALQEASAVEHVTLSSSDLKSMTIQTVPFCEGITVATKTHSNGSLSRYILNHFQCEPGAKPQILKRNVINRQHCFKALFSAARVVVMEPPKMVPNLIGPDPCGTKTSVRTITRSTCYDRS